MITKQKSNLLIFAENCVTQTPSKKTPRRRKCCPTVGRHAGSFFPFPSPALCRRTIKRKRHFELHVARRKEGKKLCVDVGGSMKRCDSIDRGGRESERQLNECRFRWKHLQFLHQFDQFHDFYLLAEFLKIAIIEFFWITVKNVCRWK